MGSPWEKRETEIPTPDEHLYSRRQLIYSNFTVLQNSSRVGFNVPRNTLQVIIMLQREILYRQLRQTTDIIWPPCSSSMTNVRIPASLLYNETPLTVQLSINQSINQLNEMFNFNARSKMTMPELLFTILWLQTPSDCLHQLGTILRFLMF